VIDWAGIKSVTKPLVAQLCGIPVSQVRWAEESEGSMWTNDPQVRLTIRSVTEIGVDEERRVDDGTHEGIITVVGPRTFTLEVHAESQVQDVSDARHAGALLSTFKTRLSRTSTVEALQAYYAVSERGPTQYVPYRDANGALIDTYTLDLICLTADNDTDDSPDSGQFIGEVIGDGKVNIDGGVQIDVPFDVKT
jgi:hypothetical protein